MAMVAVVVVATVAAAGMGGTGGMTAGAAVVRAAASTAVCDNTSTNQRTQPELGLRTVEAAQ